MNTGAAGGGEGAGGDADGCGFAHGGGGGGDAGGARGGGGGTDSVPDGAGDAVAVQGHGAGGAVGAARTCAQELGDEPDQLGGDERAGHGAATGTGVWLLCVSLSKPRRDSHRCGRWEGDGF